MPLADRIGYALIALAYVLTMLWLAYAMATHPW